MPTGRIIYSGGPHVARGPQFAHPCTMRWYVTLVKRFSCLYTSAAQQRAAQGMCERPLTMRVIWLDGPA